MALLIAASSSCTVSGDNRLSVFRGARCKSFSFPHLRRRPCRNSHLGSSSWRRPLGEWRTSSPGSAYPHPGEIPYGYQAHLVQGPNPAIRYGLQYEQPPVNHYPHESGPGDCHPLHTDPQKPDTDQLIPERTEYCKGGVGSQQARCHLHEQFSAYDGENRAENGQ
jgi:hypothetical protein